MIWTNERCVTQALTAPFGYCTLSLSNRGHVNLRLSFSPLHRGDVDKAVLATDSVSADADYDNGTTV